MTFNFGRISEKKINLLRNWGKSSEFAKNYSGTGVNYQNSQKTVQELGEIIRIREKLLGNWGKLSEFAKNCSGTGVNYQNLAKNVQTPGVNC